MVFSSSISNQFWEVIQHEDCYVYKNVIHATNSASKIITEVRIARGYVPAVRILTNVHQVVFMKPEIYFSYLHYFSDFLIIIILNKYEKEEGIKLSEYYILKSLFIGNKTLNVTNGFSTFYFCEDANKLVLSYVDLLI